MAMPGIERVRYTSPHPLFFDDDLIRAHGELEHLCPHVHLPLQSGSESRAREHAPTLRPGHLHATSLSRLRAARPDITLTTRCDRGLPRRGPTRSSKTTLEVMRSVGFEDSYSFKYSPRPDTKAAEMEGQVAAEESQDRGWRSIQELQRTADSRVPPRVGWEDAGESCWSREPSRKGQGGVQPGRQLRGRDAYHRVVNFECDSPAGTLTRAPSRRSRSSMRHRTP